MQYCSIEEAWGNSFQSKKENCKNQPNQPNQPNYKKIVPPNSYDKKTNNYNHEKFSQYPFNVKYAKPSKNIGFMLFLEKADVTKPQTRQTQLYLSEPKTLIFETILIILLT